MNEQPVSLAEIRKIPGTIEKAINRSRATPNSSSVKMQGLAHEQCDFIAHVTSHDLWLGKG